MTNEQKAFELSSMCKYGFTVKESNAAYNAALEMAEWKDKQFQKVLDYAETCYGVFSFEQRKNFINHIKKIFYEKE